MLLKWKQVMPYPEIDLSLIKTYQASARASKVTTALEGRPMKRGMRLSAFLESLPAVLESG
jgi:hypothetical protein